MTGIPDVQLAVQSWADAKLVEIEQHTALDVLTVMSPISFGLEHLVRRGVQSITGRRAGLLVILDTPGGIVEIVERIVRVLRQHYQDVRFLIPDRAMSAGTILAMSGDHILMDYHSCLGPIDPQVERGGRLVPALSYLVQFDRLRRKALEGSLSSAEMLLLQKLDLAELHHFELQRQLSVSLLRDWLVRFKFKHWHRTEARGLVVDQDMRQRRATEIADALSNQERWSTHGRSIDLDILRHELRLQIDDFGDDARLSSLVSDYFWVLRDHIENNHLPGTVHSRGFF
jgi:hypothetical protein